MYACLTNVMKNEHNAEPKHKITFPNLFFTDMYLLSVYYLEFFKYTYRSHTSCMSVRIDGNTLY